jgi:xylulokinase
VASTSATAAKLLWLRAHEPDRYAAARHLVLPKDYLRWRLTGEYATDPSDASGTLLCDIAARGWSAELLDALAIPASLLPPIVEPAGVTGALTAEAARALGLRAGIAVVAGGGDAECAALGLGLLGEASDAGCGLATLGTAGQFSAVASTPLIDAEGRMQTLCHVTPGRWHLMTAILAGGAALTWLAGVLLPGRAADDALGALLAEAEREPTGARGLLFVPHLNGVRLPEMDPSVAGAFVGLRPEHSRATLTRAAVEGVALALRDGLVAARDLGVPIERVRLAGGANRAPLWARVQADVFGVPVEVGDSEDASARGAALLAASGAGQIASLAEGAAVRADGSRMYQPDAAASAMYEELHARMMRVIAALR